MLMRTKQFILIVPVCVCACVHVCVCVCVCVCVYAESVQTEGQISRSFSTSGYETNWPVIKPLA